MKLGDLFKNNEKAEQARVVIFKIIDENSHKLGHTEVVLTVDTEEQRLEAQSQFEQLISRGMVAVAINEAREMTAITELAHETEVVFMPQISGG